MNSKKPNRLGLYSKSYKDGYLLFDHSKAFFQPNLRELYDQCFNFDCVFAAFMLPRLRYFRHYRTLLGTNYLSAEELAMMENPDTPVKIREAIFQKATDTYNASLDLIIKSFEDYLNHDMKSGQSHEDFMAEDKMVNDNYKLALHECMNLMDSFWL